MWPPRSSSAPEAMADKSKPTPAADPGDKGIIQVIAKAVVWCIRGPVGPALDVAVRDAVFYGHRVESGDEPGVYRLQGGSAEALLAFRAWAAKSYKAEEVTVAVDLAPANPSLSFELAPAKPPIRSAYIHARGDDGARMVARAVDAGLAVAAVGSERFRVTGETYRHVNWVAKLFKADRAGALEILNLTEAQVLAEDSATPPAVVRVDIPVVKVDLPTRQTVSEIVRDAVGDIKKVTQTETTK